MVVNKWTTAALAWLRFDLRRGSADWAIVKPLEGFSGG